MARAGFTLMELLVVLALMALLTGLAAPRLRPDAPNLSLEARAMAGGLRATRSTALRANDERLFLVDLAGRRYGSPPQWTAVGLGVALETYAAAEEGGRDTAAIRFFPDGSSTGGRITLSAGGRTAAITVDWLSGAVVIDERSGS